MYTVHKVMTTDTKLFTRTYVVERVQDEYLEQQSIKRKMSKSMYLRILIDEDMAGRSEEYQ